MYAASSATQEPEMTGLSDIVGSAQEWATSLT
jgi:hypothetical protein